MGTPQRRRADNPSSLHREHGFPLRVRAGGSLRHVSGRLGYAAPDYAGAADVAPPLPRYAWAAALGLLALRLRRVRSVHQCTDAVADVFHLPPDSAFDYALVSGRRTAVIAASRHRVYEATKTQPMMTQAGTIHSFNLFTATSDGILLCPNQGDHVAQRLITARTARGDSRCAM